MIGETVYVLIVDLIEYEIGETYCDCCGSETIVNTVESVVDSIHFTRESAILRDDVLVSDDNTEYDRYDGCITRIEPKEIKNYQSGEQAKTTLDVIE